jgi:hypothetical protein
VVELTLIDAEVRPPAPPNSLQSHAWQ